MTNVGPGARVEFAGSRGFVRFAGMLPNRGDITWVGIEWDDPERGRHDGSADGVQYFECANATGGSFVKSMRLGSGGRRSLLEAVYLRHALSDLDGSATVLPNTVGGKGGRIELVGAEQVAARQLRIRDARSIVLRSMGVCSVGDGDQLSNLLVNLRQLDLGHCLLSNVEDIIVLLSSLDRLEILDLSRNQFVVDGRSIDSLRSNVQQAIAARTKSELRVLVLNYCNLPLDFVVAICSICPGLQELRLFGSRLPKLITSSDETNLDFRSSLSRLKVLDVGDNGFSWEDLMSKFGQLPELESMFASNNLVTSIRCSVKRSGGRESVLPFSSLRHLSLRANDIRDWRSISELSYLPNLVSLWVNDIPLFQENGIMPRKESTRHVSVSPRDGVIARIGTLAVLDGSTIHPDERLYAEKRYLRQFTSSDFAAPRLLEVLREHPRLQELRERFDVDLTGKTTTFPRCDNDPVDFRTLRTDLVNCTMVNCGGFCEGSVAVAKRKLPVSTIVGTVNGLIARCFGSHSSSDVLLLKMLIYRGENKREIELRDETRDLRHYGVEGGQEIYIYAQGQTKSGEATLEVGNG
jgi:tubulin-specific chaperone E